MFGKQEIYNPWSVLNYFTNECRAKAFWTRTSSNDVISKLIQAGNQELYNSLETLLKGEEIQAVVDADIISEIYGNPICSLKIPNLEIKSVFQKEVLGNWEKSQCKM